jgi:Flp pilus assembly protein TadB
MAVTDTQDEICQIESDLEKLRRRYVNLDRSGHRMKVTYFVFLAALLALVMAGAAVGNWFALAASAFVLVMACIMGYAYRHERWIDRACRYGIARNEAMLVEDMVAKRMARLAELKGERK